MASAAGDKKCLFCCSNAPKLFKAKKFRPCEFEQGAAWKKRMKLWADIPQCHCKISRLNDTQKDTFGAARRCLTRSVNLVYGFDHPVDENSPIMLHPSCRKVMGYDPPSWVRSACSCSASSNESGHRKRGDMSESEGSGDNEGEDDTDPFEAWRGKFKKSSRVSKKAKTKSGADAVQTGAAAARSKTVDKQCCLCTYWTRPKNKASGRIAQCLSDSSSIAAVHTAVKAVAELKLDHDDALNEMVDKIVSKSSHLGALESEEPSIRDGSVRGADIYFHFVCRDRFQKLVAAEKTKREWVDPRIKVTQWVRQQFASGRRTIRYKELELYWKSVKDKKDKKNCRTEMRDYWEDTNCDLLVYGTKGGGAGGGYHIMQTSTLRQAGKLISMLDAHIPTAAGNMHATFEESKWTEAEKIEQKGWANDVGEGMILAAAAGIIRKHVLSAPPVDKRDCWLPADCTIKRAIETVGEGVRGATLCAWFYSVFTGETLDPTLYQDPNTLKVNSKKRTPRAFVAASEPPEHADASAWHKALSQAQNQHGIITGNSNPKWATLGVSTTSNRPFLLLAYSLYHSCFKSTRPLPPPAEWNVDQHATCSQLLLEHHARAPGILANHAIRSLNPCGFNHHLTCFIRKPRSHGHRCLQESKVVPHARTISLWPVIASLLQKLEPRSGVLPIGSMRNQSTT